MTSECASLDGLALLSKGVTMKHRYPPFAIFILAVVSSAAWAGCPLDGVYSTDNALLPGVASESEPTGQSGELGNAVHAESVGGGAQWLLSCPAICVEPVMIENTVDGSGNGHVTYFTVYCGGGFWLNGGAEAWSNGHTEYLADVDVANFTTRITFAGGVPVLTTTDIEVTAEFLDCTDTCLTFTVASACQVGEAYGADFPAGYPLPVWMDTCDPDPMLWGSWWDVCCATMVIQGCSTDADDLDWGHVKALY